jgi:hypothetical protein
MEVDVPGGPYAEAVHGDTPDPLPAVAGSIAAEPSSTDQPSTTSGPGASVVRYSADATSAYIPRLGRDAVLADLALTLALSPSNGEADPQVWLSRQDPSAERSLRAALTGAKITVLSRETRADVERGYAGNGAVLALRLLLVSGAAAVLVAVGALLVAAYIGRRQRAYDVAALRAVGVTARTARRLLLYEGIGTVGVALTCGAVAAAIASAIVLPALPQFDEAPAYAVVRYAPDGSAALSAIGALALVLLAVALTVATLQLRSGHADRLREGVR